MQKFHSASKMLILIWQLLNSSVLLAAVKYKHAHFVHQNDEFVTVYFCSLIDCKQSVFTALQLLLDLNSVHNDENITAWQSSDCQHFFWHYTVFELVYFLHYLLDEMFSILWKHIWAHNHQLSDKMCWNFTNSQQVWSDRCAFQNDYIDD